MRFPEIPWMWTDASPTGFLGGNFEPPPPGYVIRMRGLLLSVPVYATVTGIGDLQIYGFAGISQTSSSPGMTIFFQPSTTQTTVIPVDFGESGIVFAGAPSASLVTGGTTSGSYALSVSMWGAFTPIHA